MATVARCPRLEFLTIHSSPRRAGRRPGHSVLLESGADGRLRNHRCSDCITIFAPAHKALPDLRQRAVFATAVSGHGPRFTRSQSKLPAVGHKDSFILVAIVELDEQTRPALTSNVLTAAGRLRESLRVTAGFVARHAFLVSGILPVDRKKPLTRTEIRACCCAHRRRPVISVGVHRPGR